MNMDEFKKDIKSKIFVLCGGIFSCVTIILVSKNLGVRDIRIDFISGFQLGIVLAFEFVFITKLIKYRKALNDENMLKVLYIKETDERSVFIAKKTATLSFNISLSVIAIATIVSGFFNITVFFTLLGVLAFIAITKAVLKMYYKKKN